MHMQKARPKSLDKKCPVFEEPKSINNDQRLCANPRQNLFTEPPLPFRAIDLQSDPLARFAVWFVAKPLYFVIHRQAEPRVGEALSFEKTGYRRLTGADSAADPNDDGAGQRLKIGDDQSALRWPGKGLVFLSKEE
jgi:hypothetical protein